ncbi:hypothetical protein [Woodsholea maritima]|uniref:hypothetical protein n=1 Tax=Woodsholea maritima TaxID=240237 RepID=UPI00037141D0|nr:hypothetical protein [Woodsholea maritima]
MKARVTRLNQRPDPLLSGLIHHEGEMVTASDLNDHGFHATFKREELGLLTLRDGVPAEGGAIALSPTHVPSLQPGYIVADGVIGDLRPGPDANPARDAALFESQADLPEGPAWPEGEDHVLYADIWTLAQSALLNPDLIDPALHGADTAMRTRTVCQIKAAPADAVEDLMYGAGRFPQVGTGTLVAVERNEAALIDLCDPCSDVIGDQDGVTPPNALVRFEVISVEGPAHAPTKITLAWSMENASITVPVDFKDQIKRAGAVYEFYSDITELHRGVFATPSDAKRPAFIDDFDDAPNPAQDHDGSPWPFIRRWDGWLELDLNGDAVTRTLGAGFAHDIQDRVFTLSTDYFEATLDLDHKAIIAGDYWLIELRQFAQAGARVHVPQALPSGPIHHYCVLMHLDEDGEAKRLSDTDRRRVSFPALSNLPASHVGLDHRCTKLFGNAENVQDALRNLCSIAAEDIAFNNQNCPRLYAGADTVQDALDNLCGLNAELIFFDPAACPRLYGNAQTVQEALAALCEMDASKIPFDPAACPDLYGNAQTVQEAFNRLCALKEGQDYTLLLRYFFDWGVVCGILVRFIERARLQITKGYILDQMGRFERYRGETLDLNELLKADQRTRVHYDSPQILGADLRKGEVCLCLAYDDGETAAQHGHEAGVYVHLVSKRDLGPLVQRYRDVVRECLENIKTVNFKDTLNNRAGKTREVRHTMAMMLNQSAVYDGVIAFDEEEGALAAEFIKEAETAYHAIANEEEKEVLKLRMETVRDTIKLSDFVGEAKAIARARLNKALLGAIALSDEERRQRCICENAFPPCPPTKGGQYDRFVPIACLKGELEGDDQIFLEQICPWLCRKQAITLKTAQYWELWEPNLSRIYETVMSECCKPKRQDPPPITWVPDDGTYIPYDPGKTGGDWSKPGSYKEVNPDYRRLIQIEGQPLKAAKAMLEGFGLSVGEAIDTATPQGVKALREHTGKLNVLELIEDNSARPGDEAIIVMNGGAARGYLITQKGHGSYPFKPIEGRITQPAGDGTGTGGVTLPNIDLEGLRERLNKAQSDSEKLAERLELLIKTRSDTTSAVAETRAELSALNPEVTQAHRMVKQLQETLGRLTSERESHEAEVKALREDLTGLRKERSEAEEAVKTLTRDLGKLSQSRDTLIEAIGEAKQEFKRVETDARAAGLALKSNQEALEALQKSHASFMVSIKEDQPITMVEGVNAELTGRMAALGIRSVKDLSRLTPATIRKLESSDLMSRAEATRLMTAARVYLTPRPQG